MDRVGRYLKPGKRVTAPAVLFGVVVNPHVESSARTERDTLHTWGSADVCVSHYRRGRWSAPRGAHCETPEALAAWMDKNARPRARNYVVTPNAAETLALARVWERIDSGPVKWVPPGTHWNPKAAGLDASGVTVIRRLSIGARCTILDYARGERRWLWLSGRQFTESDEESLAQAVGHQWDTAPREPTPDAYVHRTARERSVMWVTFFRQMCDWWRAHARAPFGLTASALSMGMLRSHVRPKLLTSHNDPRAHRLERDACFGGRASTFYYGDIGDTAAAGTESVPAPLPSSYGSIPGPIEQWDVRSMYPWLLREQLYPVALISYREDRRPNEPQAYATECAVIARVTIETDTPEYPMRVGDRIIYPTGRFTTTLTGPELLRLKGDGRVVACHAMSMYRLSDPFRDAAAALIAMRENPDSADRPAWQMFAKYVANGLGGKLAQRRGEWQECPQIPAKMQFGEWFECGAKTGQTHRYRAIAGCVWRYVRDTTGAGPYTAAFAYLAAYGRLHMRGVRDVCPSRSVVSMDTDGVWVLPDGSSALKRRTCAGHDRAGVLRRISGAGAARFFGPRHYYAAPHWVLAGFAAPSISRGGTGLRDVQRFTPMARPAGRAPVAVCVRDRYSTLAVEAHGVSIGADGWAVARQRR